MCKNNTCNTRFITNANSEESISVVKAGHYEYKATQAKIEVRRTVARIKRRAPMQHLSFEKKFVILTLKKNKSYFWIPEKNFFVNTYNVMGLQRMIAAVGCRQAALCSAQRDASHSLARA